jgi:hypothetical protein
VPAQQSVPDRVDTAIHRMQRTASDPVLDRPASEPQLRQLRPRYDPMTPVRKLSDRRIATRLRFPMYVMGKCSLDRHAPTVASVA